MALGTPERQTFPLEYYRSNLVRLCDAIKYHDDNWTREERTHVMKAVYEKTAEHFAQPLIQVVLNVSPKVLEAGMRTSVRLIVYTWFKAGYELRAGLSIYYTYIILMDDCNSIDNPHMAISSFCSDLLQGMPQKHPFFSLLDACLPDVLSHLGGFCALSFYRNTLDFYQGCIIERHNFQGFRHSHDYPRFLRRLTGLGQGIGAALFPIKFFDETKLIPEIATSMAQFDNFIPLINDMISIYKEWDDPMDESSLTNNYRHIGDISLQKAMERVTEELLACTEQFSVVFKDSDPAVGDQLNRAVWGTVTWHLTDERYRMREVYEATEEDGGTGSRFRRYFEDAAAQADIPFEEWTLPSVTTLVERSNWRR